MKARVIIVSLLIGFPLWGMEMVKQPSKQEANKNLFIEALDYRQNSKDPIVLCFQDVGDNESEVAILKTARKAIQAMPKKPDIKAMINPLSYLSGRVVNDEAKKACGDDNGWIALCLGVSYSNDGVLNVQKYNVSSKRWEFGQQVHCKLPQGGEYNDLEASDIVVVNVPYSDNCDVTSCFTLIRSLYAKGIPLLIHSDKRILLNVNMWEHLGDLFPEKEDAKVFSNHLESKDIFAYEGDDSTEARETSSERQSESEDIFNHNHDDSAYDGDSDDADEDIFGY